VDASTFGDLEKLAKLNEERLAKMQDIASKVSELTGTGYAADQRIKAVVGGSALKDLHLDPRVMRMDSKSLAESILAAANAASLDLQKQIEEAMAPVGDESPFDYLNGKVDPTEKLRDIQGALEMSMDDIMAKAERIKRDLLNGIDPKS
jgi:DNA-binding protein YbaB